MTNPTSSLHSKIASTPLQKKRGLFTVYLWTLSFLKPYLVTLVLLVLSMAAISAVELAVPKFIQYFIDTIVPEGRVQPFYWMLAGITSLIILLIVAQTKQNQLQRNLQERAARDLQLSIFRQLRKLGFAYSERHPVGETLSFLNTEVTAVQDMYRQVFPYMLNGIIFSVVSVGLMLSTSVHLTMIVLPSFLLYYILGPYLEKKASLSGKLMATHRIAENRKVYESVSAQTEMRAYGAEQWDSGRYTEAVARHNTSMIRTYWFAYWRGTNRRLSYYAGGICIFAYGYYLVGQNSLTVGAFISFLLYYFNAMHRLTIVVTNITEQRLLMFQAERLYDFVHLQPSVALADVPVELEQVYGKVEFRDVYFNYTPGQQVLEKFTLSVPAGSRVALVGSSGSGKSTALKMVGRFYDPSQGEIRLDSVPIHELSFDTLRNAIGYVFQETYLFGTTVMENIRFGNPDASDEAVIAAATAACAHAFIMELPDGYDTAVGERGIKLSGGQKQRIAIARMFVKQPSVILLDEATSALDNVSESGVQEALERLMKGRTIIAVAHRLSTIQDFDMIVVMDQGRVAESGTYSQLMEARGLFYRLSEGKDSIGTEDSTEAKAARLTGEVEHV